MNETESPMPVQGPDIEWQVEALQRQVFLLLLALVVITATVVFYLYYQSRILTNDLDKNRPAALEIINTYNANHQMINTFESQVASYGATHPAFEQQVLKKYGLPPATASASTPAK